MDEYTNSATRLLALIGKLQTGANSLPIALAWAQVLGLDVEQTKEDPHELYAKLGLLRHELELVQKQMESERFSEGLYKPYLGNIRKVISVSNVESQWGNFKTLLNGETILALRYCSEILPRDTAIPMSELEGLLQQVVELKQEIENSSFNQEIKEFLLRLLTIIETGIRDYPVSGGGAFTNAFHEVVRAASNDGPSEMTADNSGYIKVMQVIKKCWSLSKEVVHGDRLLTIFGDKLEQGQLLLEWSVKPLN
jgi:hypothetical protein